MRQRLASFVLIASGLLYAGCSSFASQPPAPIESRTQAPAQAAPVRPSVQPARPQQEPAPPVAPTTTPMPAGEAPAASAETPLIALLLPLSSKTLGTAAESVKDGFTAAASAKPETELPIRIYPVNEQTDDLLLTYKQAVMEGARVVVGPLTKPGLTMLANSNAVSVPTLALNSPEANVQLPAKLFSFAISAEAEARQVAKLIYDSGRSRVLVVSNDTPLNRRIAAAFSDTWKKLGNTVEDDFQLGAKTAYSKLRERVDAGQPEAIFLALDSRKARLARPYLGSLIPTYATSQVHNGKLNAPINQDLVGVQFVDMPWLVDRQNELVAAYPVSDKALSADFDRLYALGIDAYRLAARLARGQAPAGLEGVTGFIELGRDQQFTRRASPASIGPADTAQ
ncbi:penicillin-binding protein activator [Chitinivorax sp. PXF-14]|uniref:penicillin-binding protein activator n=1 Tax=Chitinivorax sp. PXF-14 TaxID=3230488 RepID=UPI003466AE10